MEKIEAKSMYQHAKEAIADYIRTTVSPDNKLPSEVQFAGMLGVSRNTIREALRILEREGIVQSRHGVGTFVVNGGQHMSTSISILESATKIIKEHGHVPGTIKVASRIIAADERIAELLSQKPGAKVLYIERVRTADQIPVVFVRDYIIHEEGIEEAYAKFSGESLFAFLKERADIAIGHSLCRIKAVVSDASLEEKLNLDQTAALLLLEQTHYCSKGRICFYSDSFFLSAKFNFTVVRQSL